MCVCVCARARAPYQAPEELGRVPVPGPGRLQALSESSESSESQYPSLTLSTGQAAVRTVFGDCVCVCVCARARTCV